MKGPPGILNSKGQDGSITVCLKGSNNKVLEEYAASTINDTNTTTCFVLTGLNDVLSIQYSIDPGLVDFIDIVIDGILRESASPRMTDIPFTGIIRRVCEQGEIKKKPKHTLARGKPRLSKLQVCKRDINPVGNSTIAARCQEEVGSIEVQFYQKTPGILEGSASSSPALRASTFLDYGTWEDKARNTNSAKFPVSLFEIGFTNPAQHTKSTTERIMKQWSSDYKLSGSIKFHICSTAELQAMGFEDVPNYYVTPTERKFEVKQPTGTKEENEGIALAQVAASASQRSPQSVSNGNSSKTQSVTFSNVIDSERASLSTIAQNPDTNHSLLYSEIPNTLQVTPTDKAEAEQITLRKFNPIENVLSPIFGLKGGPAYEAWDDRDLKAAQELSAQEPFQPIWTSEPIDRQSIKPTAAIDRSSVTSISELPPPGALDCELPKEKTLELKGSPTPTEIVDEDEMEAFRLKSMLSHATIDNSQATPFQIKSSPHLSPSSFDGIASFAQSGEGQVVPECLDNNNKRKFDNMNRSSSVIHAETFPMKNFMYPETAETIRNSQFAKKRLAAAQQKNRELRQQHENLLRARQEKQMQKDLEEAEELEKHNTELQAQIDAMYKD